MVRFRASAGKSNKTVSTSWSFTGDRRFESISLQERVHCELDHDVELAVDVEIARHEQIAEEIERASEPGVDTAPRGRGIVCQVICQLMGTVSVA
jgi:hypothetical protein